MKILSNKIIFVPFVLILLFSCATSAGMYKKADSSWSRGDYALAIDYALESYEIGIDKGHQEDSQKARSFLVDRFPRANQLLYQEAASLLSGSDSDKKQAWLVFEKLVNMNSSIDRSLASYFLYTTDFSNELQDAKEVAAEIMYSEALTLMGNNSRMAYIDAVWILRDLNVMIPYYKETVQLIEECEKKATVTVAFLDEDYTVSRSGTDISLYDIEGEVHTKLMDYIEAHDYPEFLNFVLVDSLNEAKNEGATMLIGVEGELTIYSDIIDNLDSSGSLTWTRGYGGDARIEVIDMTTEKSSYGSTNFDSEQSVTIEFYPVKYSTTSLTQSMFDNQFNNELWMNSQLSQAKNSLERGDSKSELVLWAEAGFGGRALFLTSAMVPAEEGEVEKPISGEVWKNSEYFVNVTLSSFLDFDDMELSETFIEEISEGLLSDFGISKRLEKLVTN